VTLYSERMGKAFTALVVMAVFILILIVAGTAQNHGCLPWKTAVTTGGGVFSEGDRGHTYCR
jgi:hypothetical protein